MNTPDNPEHETPAPGQEWRKPLLIGYVFLIASGALYLVSDLKPFNTDEDQNFTLFISHALIAVGFFVTLILCNKLDYRKTSHGNGIHLIIILATLFLISCFALNRILPVFQESADWLSVSVALSAAGMLSFAFFDRLPRFINIVQSFFIGFALLLFGYFALRIGVYYLLAIPGLLALGVGLHAFIPLGLVVLGIVLVRRLWEDQKFSASWMFAGIIFPAAFAVYFAVQWNRQVAALEKITNQSVLQAGSGMPDWMSAAQRIPMDWITERVLKADIVYSTYSRNWLWRDIRWQERSRHDPLVWIASMFRSNAMSREDRIKILRTLSPDRARGEERLWSAEHLSTSYVVSDVDIYPDLRLAYTEKYLTIRNNFKQWNQEQEEAVYTFQLPEGSVVTSLSLWIKDREAKGILTSKKKAATAYETIVGKERRDPSVVHWQEGNTVHVRIFPCTPEEERKFKIGITSPLPVLDKRVVYRSIPFTGPAAYGADETIRIRFIGTPGHLQLPASLKPDAKQTYTAEHTYDPNFSLSFDAVPVRQNRFSFNGFTYSLTEQPIAEEPNVANEIYLDINAAWTKQDVDAVKPLLSRYALYAWLEGELVPLSDVNWTLATEELRTMNFSTFPFHLIHNPAQSLVITRGTKLSVRLSDFKDSPFAEATRDFFRTGVKVNVFGLGGIPSVYVNTFRELRGLQYASGDSARLMNLLGEHKFPVVADDGSQITLHDAGMLITKTKTDSVIPKNNAPDHLARLFAYNDVLRRVGAHYFDPDFEDDLILQEASEAYVVTPVSSLVVLETQEDYDRYGIRQNANSLMNAAKASSGAVPEPHEWALLLVLLLFVFYIRYRS